MTRLAASIVIGSPSRSNPRTPPSNASGVMWPTTKPWLPPLKRPSVISATSLPRPLPMTAEVGDNISRMPGPPRGPSYRMTMTSPFTTVPSRMRRSASSSLSNTRARPIKRRPSFPLIFATAPPDARLPYNMTRCPFFLIGSFNGRTTVWPFGYGFTRARFCFSDLPVIVRQSPCIRPAVSSIFINGWMPPMATSSLMKWRPLGLRSARTGVRAPRRVKSSSVSFTFAA